MNSTAQLTPPRTPGGTTQPTDPRRSARALAPERPPLREMLGELAPLIGFAPVGGPPVVFVLGPWLFLGLMLAAPFAALVALVAATIVAATVIAALTAAIVAPPYLLVRHLRRHRAPRPTISVPAAPVVAITSPRVAA